MRIVAFVNGELGLRALPIVASRSALVAVVVHPVERSRGRETFERIAEQSGARLIEAPSLGLPGTLAELSDLAPEWGLSAGFGYILRPDVFEIPRRGTLNIHTSLLPWNRGAHPNVWTIVDETPAGATIHWVDTGVDTGDILVQQETSYDWSDTGETLQRRLLETAESLLREHWPPSPTLLARREPQPAGGSFHRVADLASLDALDLDREMPVRLLLNILRARTYPPFRAAGIRANGLRIEMMLTPRAERDSH